jgi:hypothetical protein
MKAVPIKKCLANKTETLVKYVYVHGPKWLGSWEGQSLSDICSGITHVDAEHWTTNASISKACLDLVDRKVRAGVIGALVVTGFAVSWNLLSACMNISMFILASRIK